MGHAGSPLACFLLLLASALRARRPPESIRILAEKGRQRLQQERLDVAVAAVPHGDKMDGSYLVIVSHTMRFGDNVENCFQIYAFFA